MRYPVIEPFDSGVLEAGGGHRVFWERVGNPLGKPAVVLHGGPGSGAQPWWRTYFDPDRYSVTLFDQSGQHGRGSPNFRAHYVRTPTPPIQFPRLRRSQA